jgi:hypothetical protein
MSKHQVGEPVYDSFSKAFGYISNADVNRFGEYLYKITWFETEYGESNWLSEELISSFKRNLKDYLAETETEISSR